MNKTSRWLRANEHTYCRPGYYFRAEFKRWLWARAVEKFGFYFVYKNYIMNLGVVSNDRWETKKNS